jgi:cell wall assembly regulator SMI1
MSAIDEIRRAREAAPLPGPGGWGALKQSDVEVRIRDGLTSDEIAELETEVGAPLPRELVVLLAETAGIDGVLAGVDFTGRTLDFEDRDVFPAGVPIAADGFGNFWVLDVTPADTDVAPIFYASHDPPVVVYQSPSLAHFVRELFAMFMPPHASALDDVHEGRLFDDLGERVEVVDLRHAEIGMGFSWGRYGPRTIVCRQGYERLFACAPPAGRPGLLRRLTGRS